MSNPENEFEIGACPECGAPLSYTPSWAREPQRKPDGKLNYEMRIEHRSECSKSAPTTERHSEEQPKR